MRDGGMILDDVWAAAGAVDFRDDDGAAYRSIWP